MTSESKNINLEQTIPGCFGLSSIKSYILASDTMINLCMAKLKNPKGTLITMPT